MSTSPPISVTRLLWQVVSESKVRAVLWTVFTAMLLGVFFIDAPRSLGELAGQLPFNVMMCGQFLFNFGPVSTTTSSSEPPVPATVAQAFVTGLGAALIGASIGLVTIYWLSDHQPARSSDLGQVVPWITTLMAPLMLFIGLWQLADSTRRIFTWSQEVAGAAATAQADADAARIAALQAQMHPHFLFNALNTVASLVRQDAARAQQTIRNLTGMLTHTLDRASTPLVTLDDELQFVRDYLDIERERFGARLNVAYDVAPETTSVLVPTMSLQPVVENAIKHAIATRLEGGRVRIAAMLIPDRAVVRLIVEDDGPGFAPKSEDGTGLGNLRARLHSLYGEAATLTAENLPAGARVTLTLPHHARTDR